MDRVKTLEERRSEITELQLAVSEQSIKHFTDAGHNKDTVNALTNLSVERWFEVRKLAAMEAIADHLGVIAFYKESSEVLSNGDPDGKLTVGEQWNLGQSEDAGFAEGGGNDMTQKPMFTPMYDREGFNDYTTMFMDEFVKAVVNNDIGEKYGTQQEIVDWTRDILFRIQEDTVPEDWRQEVSEYRWSTFLMPHVLPLMGEQFKGIQPGETIADRIADRFKKFRFHEVHGLRSQGEQTS